jgi:hypothetical protein
MILILKVSAHYPICLDFLGFSIFASVACGSQTFSRVDTRRLLCSLARFFVVRQEFGSLEDVDGHLILSPGFLGDKESITS